MTEKVQIGFEGQAIHAGLNKLLPTRSVEPEVRKTRKFSQILSSIREIGLIEPLIVTPPDPEQHQLKEAPYYGAFLHFGSFTPPVNEGGSMPIRLLPTPTKCRVVPFSRV